MNSKMWNTGAEQNFSQLIADLSSTPWVNNTSDLSSDSLELDNLLSQVATAATPADTDGNLLLGDDFIQELRNVPAPPGCMTSGAQGHEPQPGMSVPPSPGAWSSISACSTPGPDNSAAALGQTARKPRSQNAAALAAKANREKRKFYVEQMETQLKAAQSRAQQLEAQVEPLKKRVCHLSREVAYLRGVVRNDSSISTVLKSLPEVKTFGLICPETMLAGHEDITYDDKKTTRASSPGMAASTTTSGSSSGSSTVSNKNTSGVASKIDTGSSSATDSDSDSNSSVKLNVASSSGVCVHVAQGDVSVRFCSACAQL
ncbi:uncharacterized protein LOC135812090 [Sycon ciliatum]|uniref:uncharacterized protein LOC135812090 n=1 Tax=Sycon ciliatum TaxID=27933 RepID=UPI0031F72112